MPIIHVEMLAGRSAETRQALVDGLTQATVGALNVAPEAVRVVLVEVEHDHWFVGGRPAARPASAPAAQAEAHG